MTLPELYVAVRDGTEKPGDFTAALTPLVWTSEQIALAAKSCLGEGGFVEPAMRLAGLLGCMWEIKGFGTYTRAEVWRGTIGAGTSRACRHKQPARALLLALLKITDAGRDAP